MSVTKQMNPKRFICMAVAVLLIVLSRVLPLPEGLSREGLTSLALLIASVVLWISETMNLAVTSILIVTIIPFLGVMTAPDMFKSFAGSVFFFVLATFSITAALATSTIPTRIAGFILRWSKNNPRKLVVGFTLGTALLSSIMSNVPTCALFAALAIAILKANGDPIPGTSNLGKALMIAVPAGSVIGGFMTPAGGPTNLLAMGFLEDIGLRITFLDWMIVGFPLGIVCCAICAIWFCIVFRPEDISDAALLSAKDMVKQAGPMNTREKKMLTIIFLMFVFWVASTWFPVLSTTLIALLGMCAFFLPGVDVLTWNQFNKNASWDVLFLIGGVGAIAAGILHTGAATWMVDFVMGSAGSWSPFFLVLMTSIVACGLHILIPTGPAVVGLAVPPMIAVALSTGTVSPVVLAVITAFWGGVTLMFPMDAVPVLTYGYGYYKITDMMRSGWLPLIVIIFVSTLFIPFMLGILGY